jgi:uncharacterized protein (TIGR02588 family)
VDDKLNAAQNKPHVVEWAVGLASTLLVAAMIGFIFYQAVTQSPLPPRLSIERLPTVAGDSDRHVRFAIHNDANRTAAAVLVHGEATRQDGRSEVAETTFDYVPAQSRATGALIFSIPVTEANLTIRASGYMDP